MITQQEAYDLVFNTIENEIRHADYTRVTDLARLYKMYITGKNIDAELKQFNPREDLVMFEQRCGLTIPVTPAVVSSIKKPFNKVPRTQPVVRKITAKNATDKAAVQEIEDKIKSFYGSENNIGGIDYYLQNRFVDMSFNDPNAWVVIEFDPFDPNTEKASPRPYEVSSTQAIRYSIVNNMVLWVIVMTDITYQEKTDNKIIHQKGKKYTLYADNFAFTFEQTAEEDGKRILTVPGVQIATIEKKGTFIVEYFETKTRNVPAFRVGYIPDIETDGRTYVNPFHDSLSYLKKSIKQGSEFDLSTCLHTFPQKIVRLTKGCPGERNMRCDRGRLTDGSSCNNCKGTGRPIHTSGQDIVEVEMVGAQDPDYVSLTDYVYYVPLPIELLRLQKQWVDELKADVHQTIFNSTVLLRKSQAAGFGSNPIDVTATERDHDMESVYDTLAPFAEKMSAVWQTIVEFIAIITDNFDKVIIIHRFPSNFRLKSRQDLYVERKALQDSGAPAFAIDSVDDELAEEIYADDADSLLKYRVKKDHYPFVGKKETEVVQLLASPDVLKKTKVLYNYYDEIFTILEREYLKAGKNFYFEKYEDRQGAIDSKVDELVLLLGAENQTAFNFKMNALPPAGIGAVA